MYHLIWMKLEMPGIGHTGVSPAQGIPAAFIKYIASPAAIVSNPPCSWGCNTKTAVISDTVKGGFHILIHHMETPVIFINRSIIIFPAAANHDVRACSQFYGPARGSALTSLVVDIIIYKHIFIVRA